MAISLTEEEEAIATTVMHPVFLSIMLINDYYSWPKELQSHLKLDKPGYPISAIPVLMYEHSVSEEVALCLLKDKITGFQVEHLVAVEALKQDGPISPNLLKCFAAGQMATSGTEVWSIGATRYPTKKSLNQATFVLPASSPLSKNPPNRLIFTPPYSPKIDPTGNDCPESLSTEYWTPATPESTKNTTPAHDDYIDPDIDGYCKNESDVQVQTGTTILSIIKKVSNYFK